MTGDLYTKLAEKYNKPRNFVKSTLMPLLYGSRRDLTEKDYEDHLVSVLRIVDPGPQSLEEVTRARDKARQEVLELQTERQDALVSLLTVPLSAFGEKTALEYLQQDKSSLDYVAGTLARMGHDHTRWLMHQIAVREELAEFAEELHADLAVYILRALNLVNDGLEKGISTVPNSIAHARVKEAAQRLGLQVEKLLALVGKCKP